MIHLAVFFSFLEIVLESDEMSEAEEFENHTSEQESMVQNVLMLIGCEVLLLSARLFLLLNANIKY